MAEYGCCHTNGTSALRDRCAANSASREPEQVGLKRMRSARYSASRHVRLNEHSPGKSGGGTGICRGIALALATAGCDVAITSRSDEHLVPTVEDIQRVGVRSVGVDLPASTENRARTRRERPDNDLDALPVRMIKPLSTTQKVARQRANAPGPATGGRSSPRQQRISAAADEPSPRRTIRKECA